MERGFQSTGKLEEMTERSVYLSKARNFAKMKHEGKFRAQGVPIFTHLEAVSRILCEEFRIPDDEKVAVGYLHDTVEDTKTTLEELAH
jgi:guanosine-3',5'-bis(diphosphate) 3'-pyrophosphohydrolase